MVSGNVFGCGVSIIVLYYFVSVSSIFVSRYCCGVLRIIFGFISIIKLVSSKIL